MKTIFKNKNWKPCLVLFFIWKIIKIIKFYLLIFLLVILIKKIVSLPLKIGFDQFVFTFLIEFWKHKIYLKKIKQEINIQTHFINYFLFFLKILF